MTEDEAKTKWCPFVRMGSESSGLGSINRDFRLGEKTLSVNCIGSACMAWRTVHHKYRITHADGSASHANNTFGLGDGARVDEAKIADGYCGLAGQP